MTAFRIAVVVGAIVASWLAVVGLVFLWMHWPAVITAAVLGLIVGGVVGYRLECGRALDVEAAHAAKDTFADTTFSNAFDAQKLEEANAVLTVLATGEVPAALDPWMNPVAVRRELGGMSSEGGAP